MTPPVTVALDLQGLKCPLPALRTRKALAAAGVGTRLVVSCTDPMAVIDVPNAVREMGAVLEARTVEGAILTFVIRKE